VPPNQVLPAACACACAGESASLLKLDGLPNDFLARDFFCCGVLAGSGGSLNGIGIQAERAPKAETPKLGLDGALLEGAGGGEPPNASGWNNGWLGVLSPVSCTHRRAAAANAASAAASRLRTPKCTLAAARASSDTSRTWHDIESSAPPAPTPMLARPSSLHSLLVPASRHDTTTKRRCGSQAACAAGTSACLAAAAAGCRSSVANDRCCP
jgi:hypothetical protein